MTHSYNKLCNFYKKIKHLKNIAGIINWDLSTTTPSVSAKYRAEELATLQSMVHKLIISEQFGDLIQDADSKMLNKWQKANIREFRYLRDDALSVDTRLLEVHTKTGHECELAWRDARKNNDFKSVAPIFRKVLSITKDIATSRSDYFKIDAYDALLSQYERGLTASKIDPVFKKLSEKLPDILKKALDKQNSEKNRALPKRDFSIDKQKELSRYLAKKLGFKGLISESTHPFCGGNAHDIRITNRYDIRDFSSGMMGVLHESGHGLYEQNLPEDYVDYPVGSSLGMAMHESQSLFVEMQISRSKEFYQFIAPVLADIFKLNKKEWNADFLHKNNCRVERSLIRVDADEVTYPLHVILRYNIEKELLSGNLQIRDLPSVWNDGMYKLIGIRPKNDSEGCMQDIHWYMGAIGYFPTYTLGAIYASQLFQAMTKDVSNYKDVIKSGDLHVIIKWLNENVHKQGSLYSSPELMKNICGKDLDADCFLAHLKSRYN